MKSKNLFIKEIDRKSFPLIGVLMFCVFWGGCKDQKLIDDHQRIRTENERLKAEIAENIKQRQKQESILENLSTEIKNINKVRENEADLYKREIASLKNDILVKTKLLEESINEIENRKKQETERINIVSDAMLYLQNADFLINESVRKTFNEGGRKKIDEEEQIFDYWDFKFDSTNKFLSWSQIDSHFINSHDFYLEKSIGHQLAFARKVSFDVSKFNGAIDSKSVEICGKSKTEISFSIKKTVSAYFNYEPGGWAVDIFKNPVHKRFIKNDIKWINSKNPYVGIEKCEFILDNQNALRFKAALEAIIKSNGGRISTF